MAVIKRPPAFAKPLTASRVANEFYRLFGHRFGLVFPNVHVPSWSECDIFAVTKSGVGIEIEIKLSRDDYFRDAKKTVTGDDGITRLKHESLAAGECYPNRFYFLVPVGLIELDELPEWAGLYTIGPRGGITKVKEAPRLHPAKPTESQVFKLSRRFVYRYWDTRSRCEIASVRGGA